MIWLQPWAWAALATIAIPVLIHLLGRGHARVQRFPTLRFLDASRLLPARRTRVHDLVLLAIRVGILTAAVAALAQPYLLTHRRRQTLDTALARAIVLDTSASMRVVLDSARRQARLLADSSQESVILETSHPAGALAGAAAWLGAKGTRSELVVVSDFHRDVLSTGDLAILPRDVGIRLVRVAGAARDAVVERHTGAIAVRATTDSDRTNVEWRRDSGARLATPVLLAGPAEQAGAAAASRAALSLAPAEPHDSTHAVAIVYPGYERRAELARSAGPLRAAWIADVVARIAADSLLISAAPAASVIAADTGAEVVVARTAARQPAVVAAQDHDRLLLFALADAPSLTSAALIAATVRATASSSDVAELDPATIPDAMIASWQRPPASTAPSGRAIRSSSDGRWFWMLALLLLGAELAARRATISRIAEREPSSPGQPHAA